MHLKSVLSVFVSVLLSMVLSSCVVGLLELHIAYASPYTNIGVDVAYNMITGDSYPNLAILDVRTQSEYGDGHIYGAVWIPYTELQARISELTGYENHEMIVYCKSGGRSAIASETLDSNNFTKVYNMLGGISAWQYSGYPVWIATVHNVNTTFNYDTIQAAIKAPHTLNGHTILVDEGTYHENVVVNKTVSLIGEIRETTIIDGGGNTVLHIKANNVTINGFTIHGASAPYDGIEMEYLTSNYTSIVNNIIANNSGHGVSVASHNNIISNNLIINNAFAYSGYCGISMYHFDNNTVCNNIISGNAGHGIALGLGSSNLIKANRIMNNGYGHLPSYEHAGLVIGQDATANIIIENIIKENQQGILLIGSDNKIYHNNIVNNTKQVIKESTYTPINTWNDGYPSGGNYWSDYTGTDSNGDGIGDIPYVIDVNNQDNYPLMHPYGSVRNLDSNLTYLTIQSAINAPETLSGHTIFVETGIYYEHVIANKSLSLIGENKYNTIIDGNGTGNVIEVTASNCKITGFNIQNSGSLNCGIYVVQWNTGNNISYNILTNNYWGIWLYRSCDNTVSGNNVSSNDYIGIWVDSSGNNTVSGNNVSSNNYVGIRLDYSSSNNSMVSGNIVSNNDYGIFLASSAYNNTICGNNVANNNYGIYLSGTSNNMFFHNNFVGNTQQVVSYDPSLWDNGCEGNYWSNYNGTDLDGDGIGDTELPWEGVDNYPLMNPYWLPGDVNHDLKIDIYDVVRITGIYNSQQGDPNWNCHSDIAEPYGIINIYDVVTCTKDYRKEYTP